MDNNRTKQKESYQQNHERIRKENEEIEKWEKIGRKKARRIKKIKTYLTIALLLGGLILIVKVLPNVEPDIHGHLDISSKFDYIFQLIMGYIIIPIVFITSMHYTWVKDKRHDYDTLQLENYQIGTFKDSFHQFRKNRFDGLRMIFEGVVVFVYPFFLLLLEYEDNLYFDIDVGYYRIEGDFFNLGINIYMVIAYMIFFIMLILRRRLEQLDFYDILNRIEDKTSIQFKQAVKTELLLCHDRKGFHYYCMAGLSLAIFWTLIIFFREYSNWQRIIRELLALIAILIFQMEIKNRENMLSEKYNLSKR